ncbi:ATP-binding protein [Aquabacterium humicola]|uniref:ATP-binding protein n=1 Tax=Aquabacterium humicola TaxID=3237377 RepID=UPI0025432E47|nr:winged helix-turn-helix domain-containing protein [Rubrivivax pictus]
MANTLRFGRFELRPAEHRLLADGQPVPLGGRAFDLLLALVQRPGELVGRNELIEQVWPGRVVEENNLTVQVNALRKALGSEWLVTVPGRGYRFVAPAPAATASAPSSPSAPASPSSTPLPATTAAPLPSGPRTNLPVLQPQLIGRSDDLAALGTLVDQHRLVTVVGAGGIGKTRLVQALMQLRANAYPQGVCWVELGNVGTSAALPPAVAAALGLQSPPGDALAHLARTVAGLQMLLALDNAEHLLDDVAGLAQALLDAAPALRLVITSQAPLRLAQERIFRLGPLALPQGPLPAQQAQSFGAVALFCERAAAADHRFVLDEADVPAVIELCRHLDGVALAIELAAARAPALGIPRLQQALSDRLQVFSSNRNRLAPARQQSLRAALEWSVGLLAPFEQQLFRRLGVVASSASLGLVQRLGTLADDDAAPADAWAVVDALDQLVQRSLVDVVQAEGAGPTHYRLLESPRALALEQLAAAGEAPVVRLRFAHAVLDELDAARTALLAGELGLQDWRQLGARALDNARAALACANDAGLPALELALASAMMPAALNAERLALADRCEQLIAACADRQAPLDPVRVYDAWREISVALANMRPQRSLVAARHALALARQLDASRPDRYALYDALCATAHMLVDDDDALPAVALLQEARTLEDPGWPPVRLLPGLRVQASIAMARHEVSEALRLYRRVLDVGHAAGDPGVTTQLNLANAELLAGDAEAAVASGIRLVALIQPLRNENMLFFARINLAAAHLMLHQTAPARQQLHEALPRPLRGPLQTWCMNYLALLAALEGRFDDAAQLVGATDARYATDDEQRQVNEQRAYERTLQLLCDAPADDAAIDALITQGRTLSDADVVQLALQAVERAP